MHMTRIEVTLRLVYPRTGNRSSVLSLWWWPWQVGRKSRDFMRIAGFSKVRYSASCG